jgi:peptide/nickel transport system permease protein
MSFLGLGVNPPQPEWGAIISEAREFLRTSAYLMFFPGVFIIFSSLSINLMGDGLRDALDPRLKS